MKKLLILSAVLLGTTVATQAGMDVRIGIPLPPLPRIVIGHPAPRVVVVQEPACRPAPPPPVYCPPRRVCYTPPPVVMYPRHGYGYGHGYRRGYGHGRYDGYYRR